MTFASPDAQRICALRGLQQKLFNQLIVLKDLEVTLDVAIREAESSIQQEDFWRAMEVSAKLVQVSCDLLIAGLEKQTGPAGKAVSTLYDVSKLVVDGINGGLTPKKVFVFSTGAKIDAIADHLEKSGTGKFSDVLSRAKLLGNLANDLYEYWQEGRKGHADLEERHDRGKADRKIAAGTSQGPDAQREPGLGRLRLVDLEGG